MGCPAVRAPGKPFFAVTTETPTELVDGTSPEAVVTRLRQALVLGQEWPRALLESIAGWTVPSETIDGRRYDYFIGGEAFDWLLLAERLCEAAGDLIPCEEKEALLFSEELPPCIDQATWRDMLGVDKYRAYLNFYYGVTVEEAIQLAEEERVHKRHISNGVRYKDDHTEEAFAHIYRSPSCELLQQFAEESGRSPSESMTIGETREFTYWLFKYRLRVADKARIASDTKKGIDQLRRMRETAGAGFANGPEGSPV